LTLLAATDPEALAERLPIDTPPALLAEALRLALADVAPALYVFAPTADPAAWYVGAEQPHRYATAPPVLRLLHAAIVAAPRPARAQPRMRRTALHEAIRRAIAATPGPLAEVLRAGLHVIGGARPALWFERPAGVRIKTEAA
jgi:hypothetical protein